MIHQAVHLLGYVHTTSRVELSGDDFSEPLAEEFEMLGRPHQRLSSADDVKLKALSSARKAVSVASLAASGSSASAFC